MELYKCFLQALPLVHSTASTFTSFSMWFITMGHRSRDMREEDLFLSFMSKVIVIVY